MHTPTLILLVSVVVIGILVIAGLILLGRRKTRRLRDRFGPEYAHAVDERGRGKAEADLRQREKHVDKLTIRPLSASDRDFYTASWRKVQSQFVDDPKTAVTQADQLLGVVMSTCGYSVPDFEQRSADISVDHPEVVANYRAAHEVALRHERGEASTEDLRRALIHYRTLFEELVGDPQTAHAAAAE